MLCTSITPGTRRAAAATRSASRSPQSVGSTCTVTEVRPLVCSTARSTACSTASVVSWLRSMPRSRGTPMTTSANTSPPLSRTRTERTSSTPGTAQRRVADPLIETARREVHQRLDVAHRERGRHDHARSPRRRVRRSRPLSDSPRLRAPARRARRASRRNPSRSATSWHTGRRCARHVRCDARSARATRRPPARRPSARCRRRLRAALPRGLRDGRSRSTPIQTAAATSSSVSASAPRFWALP